MSFKLRFDLCFICIYSLRFVTMSQVIPCFLHVDLWGASTFYRKVNLKQVKKLIQSFSYWFLESEFEPSSFSNICVLFYLTISCMHIVNFSPIFTPVGHTHFHKTSSSFPQTPPLTIHALQVWNKGFNYSIDGISIGRVFPGLCVASQRRHHGGNMHHLSQQALITRSPPGRDQTPWAPLPLDQFFEQIENIA